MPSPINYEECPPNLVDGFKRFIEQGILPGGFIQAVLNNDLKESFALADIINRLNMFNIVYWVYNHAPKACWGSPEIVKAWAEKGGLNGVPKS